MHPMAAGICDICGLGLGPILEESINHYERQTGDREQGRMKAIKEYFGYLFRFDDETVYNMKILETQAGKQDRITAKDPCPTPHSFLYLREKKVGGVKKEEEEKEKKSVC